VRQHEQRAVDKANSDHPVGRGLDLITLAKRVADHDLNGSAARTPQRAIADRRINGADDLGKPGRNGLFPGLDVGRN
jgi:hypothetical protein